MAFAMKDGKEAHDTDIQITLIRVSVSGSRVGHTGNHHFQVKCHVPWDTLKDENG
jgi:hypothetical protein